MKTKYLDNEIELLNAIKRNDELSDYGKEKLSEFNAIKQALTIPVVSICSNCKMNGMQPMNDSPCNMLNECENTCSNYNEC